MEDSQKQGTGPRQKLQAQVESLQQQLDTAQQEISALKQRNGEQKLKIDQQSQQILALIAKEDSSTRQIALLNNANKELQDQYTATNNKLLVTASSLRHLQGQTESRVQWFSRKTEEAGYESR